MQRATLRAKGHASGRAGHDGHADSAHARADDLRRPRRLGHARDAAGPPADQDDRQARIAARRDLRVHAQGARRRPSGLRHLSARRGIGEGRSPGGDRDGRPPAAGRLPGVSRRAPARPDEAGREGSGDAGLRARRVPHPRLDDGRRSRRRRAERVGHGRRARRAVRALAAAPAARPRRPRPRISRTASCCIRRRSATRAASG